MYRSTSYIWHGMAQHGFVWFSRTAIGLLVNTELISAEASLVGITAGQVPFFRWCALIFPPVDRNRLRELIFVYWIHYSFLWSILQFACWSCSWPLPFCLRINRHISSNSKDVSKRWACQCNYLRLNYWYDPNFGTLHVIEMSLVCTTKRRCHDIR